MRPLKGSALFARNLISKAALIVSILGCSSAHAAGPAGPGEGGGYETVAPRPAEAAPETDFLSFDTGYAFTEDSNFYYADFWAALNGDSSRSGFVIDGYGGWGNYHYFNSDVPGGRVDAELTELSALLGYQVIAGKVTLSASAGVDWQDNRLSPKDPTNPVSGSETDFIAAASMKAPLSERLDLKLNGGYSIVNGTYWAKGRIGYKFGESRRFKIGPEGAFYGNENQNAEGVGAFISVPLGKRLDLSFAGGFKFVANDEFFGAVKTSFAEGSFGGLAGLTDGGYANVTLSTWY
jgi:hypothetical protein